jgi:hypothetical protein
LDHESVKVCRKFGIGIDLDRLLFIALEVQVGRNRSGMDLRFEAAACHQQAIAVPAALESRKRSEMMGTVADQFAETLAAVGAKGIYGIVGDSLNGLTDAIRRQGRIEWIHVRHEEVAAFAAGAEAHLTGELAVCAGSCGPGNLHLINGLFD